MKHCEKSTKIETMSSSQLAPKFEIDVMYIEPASEGRFLKGGWAETLHQHHRY
jgi:hypothetical protein